MRVDLKFRGEMDGTVHVWKFQGDTELMEVWPDMMIQGGEAYSYVEKGDIPPEVENIIKEAGFTLTEE